MIGSVNLKREEFLKRLNDKDYKNLEEELEKEYKKTGDLSAKLFLGICFYEQYNKKKETIAIFKELILTDKRMPFMFSFLAKNSNRTYDSYTFIIKGLEFYPDNIDLKNCFLLYASDDEKISQSEKLIDNNELNFLGTMTMSSYYFSKKEYLKSFDLINSIDLKSVSTNEWSFSFLKLITNYLAKKEVNRKELSNLIISSENDYMATFFFKIIEILIEKEEKNINQLVRQLPYLTDFEISFIEIINFSDGNNFIFELDELFDILINELEQKVTDKRFKNKFDIIKFSKLFYYDPELNKKDLRKMLKICENEFEEENDKYLYLMLLDIYKKLNDNKKYFDTYITGIERDFIDSHYLDFIDLKEEDLQYMINSAKNIKIYDFNAKKYQHLFYFLIKKLHDAKKSSEICKLLDIIDYKKLDYLKFGFEIAFAYQDLKRDKEAKKVYEGLIKYEKNNSSALNNLGVIYESEGKYEKALKLYEKSERLNHDTIYINNIDRCKKIIEEENQEKVLEEKALQHLENESIWIINKIKNFYSNADEYGNIICSYKMLPTLLKCNQQKSEEVLKHFSDKYYIFKNNNHNYDTLSSVYKKNKLVHNKILKMEKENKIINDFTSNLDNLTLGKLKELNYIEAIAKFNTITSEKVKKIFIRDYNELVFNYLTNQSKSVILLSGTLIELLLIHILELNKITQYYVGQKPANKKVVEMDITEMLDVCIKENKLHNTPGKFIDGMKHFRNYIHPGKEIRDRKINLNKTTVELAMGIVNWLIITIDFK